MAVTSKWPRMTSGQLFEHYLRFDLKWPFDLDLTPPWWPLGQRLSMDQIWSTCGQGLTSYGRDLEMTSDDLRSTFWRFFEIWPQMTFWPWMTLTTPPKKFRCAPRPEPLHVTKFQPHRPYGSLDMPRRRTAHGARRTANGVRRTGKVNAMSLPELFRRDKKVEIIIPDFLTATRWRDFVSCQVVFDKARRQDDKILDLIKSTYKRRKDQMPWS